MRRSRASWLTLAVFVALVGTLRADSSPEVIGFVAGRELCPQSFCGVAVFAGRFVGYVDGRLSTGLFAGAITHEDLPDPFETSNITGGQWLIWTFRHQLGGVAPSGFSTTATTPSLSFSTWS